MVLVLLTPHPKSLEHLICAANKPSDFDNPLIFTHKAPGRNTQCLATTPSSRWVVAAPTLLSPDLAAPPSEPPHPTWIHTQPKRPHAAPCAQQRPQQSRCRRCLQLPSSLWNRAVIAVRWRRVRSTRKDFRDRPAPFMPAVLAALLRSPPPPSPPPLPYTPRHLNLMERIEKRRVNISKPQNRAIPFFFIKVFVWNLFFFLCSCIGTVFVVFLVYLSSNTNA